MMVSWVESGRKHFGERGMPPRENDLPETAWNEVHLQRLDVVFLQLLLALCQWVWKWRSKDSQSSACSGRAKSKKQTRSHACSGSVVVAQVWERKTYAMSHDQNFCLFQWQIGMGIRWSCLSSENSDMGTATMPRISDDWELLWGISVARNSIREQFPAATEEESVSIQFNIPTISTKAKHDPEVGSDRLWPDALFQFK